MENLNYMIMMALFMVPLVTLETLFCRSFEKRKNFLPCLLLSILLTGLYIWNLPLDTLGIFIQLPLFFISLLYLCLCYQCSPIVALYIGIACYMVVKISSMLDSLIALIDPVLFNHFENDGLASPVTYIEIILCYIVVCVAAYWVLIRRMEGFHLEKRANIPIVILSGAMLLLGHTWGMYFNLYQQQMPGVEVSEYALSITSICGYVWSIACYVLCLIVQFGINTIGRQEQELEVVHRLIAEKEQQYRISKSTMEAVNRKSHDLKYQLSAFSAGQTGQRELDEAFALVDSFDTNIHTGNETLDVIFTEKNQFCQQHGITFVCMIDGEKLSFMETTEQYVLFGNMIDNAINAVMKLPENVDRSIYITVRQEKKLLLIQTENPFVGKLEFRDGLPRTTSGDEFNHGYGMSSIRLLCEKYGGSVSAKAKDGVFYLNIVIPVE